MTTDLTEFEELLVDPLTNEKLLRVLELLIEENFAERGCLWLPNRDLFYIGDESLRERFPFSRSVVKRVLSKGRGFVSFDSETDERLEPSKSIAVNNVRSCLCSAARSQEGVIRAVAYFDNCASVGNFTEEDLGFLNSVMALFPSTDLVIDIEGEDSPFS